MSQFVILWIYESAFCDDNLINKSPDVKCVRCECSVWKWTGNSSSWGLELKTFAAVSPLKTKSGISNSSDTIQKQIKVNKACHSDHIAIRTLCTRPYQTFNLCQNEKQRWAIKQHPFFLRRVWLISTSWLAKSLYSCFSLFLKKQPVKISYLQIKWGRTLSTTSFQRRNIRGMEHCDGSGGPGNAFF